MSIRIQGLCFRYGARTALDGITITVNPGTIAGLLGNNGAGKSTLFKILCGLLSPLSGSVHVGGFALPERRLEARRKIGYVAQQFGLYEDLTVEENLCFYAKAYGLDRTTAAGRVGDMLDQFELAPRRRDAAGSLSHGWKQRLAFAAALMHRPAVLLLDEVTAGLDPAARQYAWSVARSEAARGATVLLSTHLPDEAARCDVELWLDEGRLVSAGPPEERS